MSKCKYCEQAWHTSSQCFFKPNKQSKPCKFCTATTHISWQCRDNPNRKTEMSKKIRNGIKVKNSKLSKLWLATRRAWFKANEADLYICYLCGKWMLKNETTLDHIQSRSRHPELRFELSNLDTLCYPCNQRKGSLSLDEMRLKQSEQAA